MAGTISDKIQAILASKADIAAAIEEKGGIVPQKLSEYGNAIRALPSGEEQEPADLEFIDYDGTVLHRYTYAQAMALTELPPLPTKHLTETPALRAQGWNYTLQEIKDNLDAYKNEVNIDDVKKYLGLSDDSTLDQLKQELGLTDETLLSGILDAVPGVFVVKTTVGCNYITDDEVTYLTVEVGADSDNTFCFAFAQVSGSSVKLEWGDGSVNNPVGSNAYTVREHTYAAPGTYTIKVTQLASGDPKLKLSGPICGLQSSGTPNIVRGTSCIKSIKLGKISELSNWVFSQCINLESIAIPTGIGVGTGVFAGCPKLKAVVFPSGATSVNQEAVAYCSSLTRISIPRTVTTVGQKAFLQCPGIEHLGLVSTITNIGDNAFKSCGSLKAVYGGLPANGTYGVSLFAECGRLQTVQICNGAVMGGGSFLDCTALKSTGLDEMSSLGGSTIGFFSGCVSLEEAGTITATNVPKNAFYYCKSLKRVEFKDNGSQITFGDLVFAYSSIVEYDFTQCEAVPVISASTFSNTPYDKRIYIPASLASTWKAASNWSSMLYLPDLANVEDFSASKSYAQGELCKYWSAYYARKTAGSGSWNTNNWTLQQGFLIPV